MRATSQSHQFCKAVRLRGSPNTEAQPGTNRPLLSLIDQMHHGIYDRAARKFMILIEKRFFLFCDEIRCALQTREMYGTNLTRELQRIQNGFALIAAERHITRLADLEKEGS